MKEKYSKKISNKKMVLMIILILAIILGVILLLNHREVGVERRVSENTGLTSKTNIYTNTDKKLPNNSNITYSVKKGSLEGVSSFSEGITLDNIFIKSYDELIEYLSDCFGSNYKNINVEKNSIEKYFGKNFFENNNLAIFMHDASTSNDRYTIKSVITNNKNTTINIENISYTYGGVFGPNIEFDFIILDKSVNKVQFDIYETTYNNSYTPEYTIFTICFGIIVVIIIILVKVHISRYNKIVDGTLEKMDLAERALYGIVSIIAFVIIVFLAIMSYESLVQENTASYKPIIYLYPEEEKEVSVELKNKNMITVSYPKYINGWKVKANRQGSLIDLETNKNLYSLYYECNNIKNYKIEDEGFIVKGENSAEFLEEKLAILGLSDREAEEFIIYWLPKLESNKYNYIRFATKDEIETNMPLEITPKPDTTIRIIMTFKGLDNPVQIKEQKLEKVERRGFVAVEWGGSEIK